MIRVERSLTVATPAPLVAEYLADFAHAVEWDPGTVSCVRVDDGEIDVGTRWRNVSEFRGKRTELTYRLTRLDPGRITLVGQNRTATSTDDFTLHSGPAATTVRYRATIVLHGLAKLASPFLKREFERLGDEVAPELAARLEQLGPG
ncbi:Polyketide cyclase / dehydrase and lipid transport [Amycolatopsis lurida]|uniref:Polyketide cyclase n=1 Tax=Amycolatopsis lurida NRRL 2430 TaxID=1460371 RepID=A0A2P2FZF4_AMYLU|nr:SRPBCC family protein [Amycolatopsis lurida]KFU82121.1 polyketide cyclase [Amycolatopsis lurida NRRL 2430]SEC46358.1 Polyketide cyclase / dehydrase and lipid transport [Amycolatopsis lurida]